MNKPFVVLADLDANYLVPLEDKLTEELYDQIDLEIITDKEYFDVFFSTPRKIDTLIISSDLFTHELNRHNITDFFVLSEDVEEDKSSENVTHIFKYSSTKEIFNQILYKNKEILSVQFTHKETQVILITSGVGGSGKTTISMALSESLANNHKRVLYISTDALQSFSYYLQNKGAAPNSIVRVFGCNDDRLYTELLPYLRHEGFTYLPPFGYNIFSLGLDSSIYNRFIKAAKGTKDFDYIIVDTDLTFDEAKAEMVKEADKVIINVLQDAFSTHKTEMLLKNMDCRNGEKFIFVCNKFRRDVDNEYVMSNIGQQFMITEYIEEIPPHKICSLANFVQLSGIRNLAYTFT